MLSLYVFIDNFTDYIYFVSISLFNFHVDTLIFYTELPSYTSALSIL